MHIICFFDPTRNPTDNNTR